MFLDKKETLFNAVDESISKGGRQIVDIVNDVIDAIGANHAETGVSSLSQEEKFLVALATLRTLLLHENISIEPLGNDEEIGFLYSFVNRRDDNE